MLLLFTLRIRTRRTEVHVWGVTRHASAPATTKEAMPSASTHSRSATGTGRPSSETHGAMTIHAETDTTQAAIRRSEEEAAPRIGSRHRRRSARLVHAAFRTAGNPASARSSFSTVPLRAGFPDLIR